MTNEVATAAGLTDRLCGEFANHVSKGRNFWNDVLTWLGDRGVTFLVNLVVATLILLVGWLAIRLITAAVARMLARSKRLQALLAHFIVSVVSKCCWAFLIVMVLERLGVDVGPLIAGLGVTGFIIGFACQESLGNLASGMMIAINQPFKVGDYVIVAGHEGTVIEVNMMATVLGTPDNKKIVVPNKSAWGAPITNFSAMATRRVDLKIGIDYGNDVQKAIKVALEALSKVPEVLKDPLPSVSIASLDDSQVTLNVRPWTKTAEYWNVYSAAYAGVKTAFEQNGISIPFPQLDVHIEK